MKINRLLLVVSGIFLMGACTSDNEEDLGIDLGNITRDERVISFQSEVRPIINADCAIPGCHNGSVSSLPDYTIDQTFVDLSDKISTRVRNGSMPRGRKLSFEEKDIIISWVNQGAELD